MGHIGTNGQNEKEMRTAKDIFNEMAVGLQTASRWITIIEQAQTEAWNEAINAAAESAKTKDIIERQNPMSIHQIIDKQSILKLLK